MLLHLRECSQREQVVIHGDQPTGNVNYTESDYYLGDVSKRTLATIQFQRPPCVERLPAGVQTNTFMTSDGMN